MMWYWYLLSREEKSECPEGLSLFNSQYLSQLSKSQSLKKQQFYDVINPSHVPYLLVLNDKAEDSKSKSTQENNFQQSTPELVQQKIEKGKSLKTKSLNFPQKKNKKNEKVKNTPEPKSQYGRNPGRNSTSNIFRVFVKLCSKPKFESILKDKFEAISTLHSFFISFEYFKIRVKQLAPPTSNYINVKQFKKASQGDSEFSIAFRCLFHWFSKNYAPVHCLTLKGKHRMMKESIISFLGNLHDIEGELWGKQIERQMQIQEEYVKCQPTQ